MVTREIKETPHDATDPTGSRCGGRDCGVRSGVFVSRTCPWSIMDEVGERPPDRKREVFGYDSATAQKPAREFRHGLGSGHHLSFLVYFPLSSGRWGDERRNLRAVGLAR